MSAAARRADFERVERLIRDTAFSSVVQVARGDRTLYARAAGHADRARGLPNTPTSRTTRWPCRRRASRNLPTFRRCCAGLCWSVLSNTTSGAWPIAKELESLAREAPGV